MYFKLITLLQKKKKWKKSTEKYNGSCGASQILPIDIYLNGPDTFEKFRDDIYDFAFEKFMLMQMIKFNKIG